MRDPITTERISEILDDSVESFLEKVDTMKTLDDVKLAVSVFVSRVRVCAKLLKNEAENDD